MWAAGCVVAEVRRPDHQPLFDAGPLGSELGLIKSMFSILGTPTESSWPSVRQYPDWGKMRFHDYPAKTWEEILGKVEAQVIDLVRQLVVYENTQRMTAHEVCEQKKEQRCELLIHPRSFAILFCKVSYRLFDRRNEQGSSLLEVINNHPDLQYHDGLG